MANAALETCICAAIRTDKGTVVVGRRHHDCLGAMANERIPKEDAEQGFLTSIGRFVDRREGYKLQHKAGIKSAALEGYRGRELYSEDLY